MAGILKRFSHRLMVVAAAAMLTVGTFAVAQEFRGDHPDTYVVKRGDTLWDIAGRFLKRPWLWPEIWQANPQIQNPHLIYPGDTISLAYLDRVTVTPGPRTGETPINAIPLSMIEAYLRDARVVDSFKELPYVVAIEDDRSRGLTGHRVYIRGLDSAQVGQHFTVVRPTVRYVRSGRRECCDLQSRNDYDFRGSQVHLFGLSWSETAEPELRGEVIGNELYRVNGGSLTKVEQGRHRIATLLLDGANGEEVRVGDRLIPTEARTYDLQFFPHPPKQPIESDGARVLSVANALTSGGPLAVVALSVGKQDGVDNGTVVSLWRQGTKENDHVLMARDRGPESVVPRHRVQLPDEYASHAMIFRTFDKVSYALVMQSVSPTRVGYLVKHPDAK